VDAGEQITDVAAAAVWGLVRSAGAEAPDRFVLVDVDREQDSWDMWWGEEELAIRGDAALVPRLVRVRDVGPVPELSTGSGSSRSVSGGTVLITGGTGVLSGLLACHLVRRHGVTRLVLVSRRGLEADRAPALVAELEALGAEVTVAACDVADRSAMAEVVEQHRPVGVVHMAGVLDDCIVESLDADRLAAVLRPKVDGAIALDELTRDLDLAWFITFSSAAGVLSNAGQSSYAAANVFLDALMTARRAQGLPGLSLAWGLWELTREFLEAREPGSQRRSWGMIPLTVDQGLAMFDAAVAGLLPVQIPVRLDLDSFRARAAEGVPPLLRSLIRPARRNLAGGSIEQVDLPNRLKSLSREAQEQFILDLVKTHVGAVLGHRTAAEIDPGRSFFDLGFDSLTFVELRNELHAATGLNLAVAPMFDHPTSSALARHLLVTIRGDDAAERQPERVAASR
jgi:hypothetical protein